MGGIGSGGWTRATSKAMVNYIDTVDIRYLKKQGALFNGNNGSLTWSINGKQVSAINYQVREKGITLIYKNHSANLEEWHSVNQFVPFDYTPCNYGGKRTWLLCTGCNRRVACIYAAGRYFLCRHCYGLNYRSQHENFYDRQLSKTQKIRVKLGGEGNLIKFFPEKPKGMHFQTYLQLWRKAFNAETLYYQGLEKYISRLSVRFN
ncbi:MAG: hypothetical protein V3U87_11580 [Methylococcaceae bacterium]